MDQVESAYRNIFRSDARVFLGKKRVWGDKLLENEELIADFKGKYVHIGRPKSKDKILKDQLMFMIFEYKPFFDIVSQDIDKLSEATRRNLKASGTLGVAIRVFQMYIKSDMFIVMKRSFVKKNLLNNKPLYFVRHSVMPVYTNEPRKVVDLIQKRINP